MAYASSKTADILFAAALARRYGSKGIIASSADVGGAIAETNLAAHFTDAEIEPCKFRAAHSHGENRVDTGTR